MFSYVFIICLSDHPITYRHSYPKSRDATASKNVTFFAAAKINNQLFYQSAS